MHKIDDRKTCTSFAGHFDDHAFQAVRCQANCPLKHVQGYLRSHWTLPLGKYLPHIAPANAMVINLCPKKMTCGVVKLLSKASDQKAQNGPSTQFIKATSCVEKSNAMIKAKEPS